MLMLILDFFNIFNFLFALLFIDLQIPLNLRLLWMAVADNVETSDRW